MKNGNFKYQGFNRRTISNTRKDVQKHFNVEIGDFCKPKPSTQKEDIITDGSELFKYFTDSSPPSNTLLKITQYLFISSFKSIL